jgi:hypothetical protein
VLNVVSLTETPKKRHTTDPNIKILSWKGLVLPLPA